MKVIYVTVILAVLVLSFGRRGKHLNKKRIGEYEKYLNLILVDDDTMKTFEDGLKMQDLDGEEQNLCPKELEKQDKIIINIKEISKIKQEYKEVFEKQQQIEKKIGDFQMIHRCLNSQNICTIKKAPLIIKYYPGFKEPIKFDHGDERCKFIKPTSPRKRNK